VTHPRSLLGLVVALVAAGVVWWTQGGTTTTTAPDPSAAASSRTSGTPGTPGTTAGTDPASGLAWVELADLPPEAADTVRLIDRGGPFRYHQDGDTFGNFEGLLPERQRGYYREYTVLTPGSPDRGARRIVAGSGGEFYWTSDHYASFERIAR
jgi:ribonuclease T1